MANESINIPLTKFNINGITFPADENSRFKLFNIGPTPMPRVGFHVEPISFIPEFDDITNSKAWLLTPYSDGTPKIRIKLDNDQEFGVAYSIGGAEFNNPYTFERRLPLSTKVTIPPLHVTSDVRKEVYQLYGNDNTKYGKDWTERVNNKYLDLNRDPLDYVDSEGYTKDSYIGDHLFNSQYYRNKNEDDFLLIQILAVNHESYDQQKIIKACENVVLSMYYPTKNSFPDDLMYLNQKNYAFDKFLGI